MSRRILIVDDEDDIREFIGYNLRREGYDISTASNGKEAVEVARTTQPHLILLDMMMPIMDGRQACEEIRKIAELNDTIIVFLSAVQEEQCQIESYLAGADDYITKPFSTDELLARVKALLRRKEKFTGENLTYADITLSRDTFELSCGDKKICFRRKDHQQGNPFGCCRESI